MQLYGANITSWSKQASIQLRYLVDASMILVAEHRMAQQNLQSMRWELATAGWAATIAPAIGTEKGGTSAGTMVMWEKHLNCRGLDLHSAI